ncbi:MAG TPA: CoA pyrophosphatase [Myxococcota bacterium]|jgi:8-oxo-dGTP pyrophosphatase MutT (NUDIX family)
MTVPPIRAFDVEGLARVSDRLAHIAPRDLDGDLASAAVLVPLCTKSGEPAILFTKRTETVGTHKGQVSFPGGRRDPADSSDEDTALRELHEELGIPARDVTVLGRFHEVMSITRMRVRPIVGFVGERADASTMTPSPAEIDAVFALTLDELLAHREVRPLVRSGRDGPWYTGGPHPVWGLTAFILEEFLRDVLALPVPALDLLF